MDPLLLAGGALALYALTGKKPSGPQQQGPQGTQTWIPETSSIAPAGAVATGAGLLKGILTGSGLLVTAAKALAPVASAVAAVVGVALSTIIGVCVFVAFAVAAILPGIFFLVALISREVRRPPSEFIETLDMVYNFRNEVFQQMLTRARETIPGRDLQRADMDKITALHRVWVCYFILQWQSCRKKACEFGFTAGKQCSNTKNWYPSQDMQWKRDRGLFLDDDDIDTLSNIACYRGAMLTADEKRDANYPYKQFSNGRVPWAAVAQDAAALGLPEDAIEAVRKSAVVFANAQYFLYISKVMTDGMGPINWGPYAHPDADNTTYRDWADFVTGASWHGSVWGPTCFGTEVSGVFYDEILSNGDIAWKGNRINARDTFAKKRISVAMLDPSLTKYSLNA